MTSSPNPNPPRASQRDGHSTWFALLPFAWLSLSAAWAAVIVVTDQVAWPLAIWIATTLGPITATERRRRRRTATGPAGART